MVNVWKILAIVFGVLFIIETSLVIYFINEASEEIIKQSVCYYEICEGYLDSSYVDKICDCFDYDEFDSYNVVKTTLMYD